MYTYDLLPGSVVIFAYYNNLCSENRFLLGVCQKEKHLHMFVFMCKNAGIVNELGIDNV